MSYFTVIERHEHKGGAGGWTATVAVRGERFVASLQQGSVARARYGKRGFKWSAYVVERQTGEVLLDVDCTKSAGLVWMLERAGVIPLREKQREELQQSALRLRKHIIEMETNYPKHKQPGTLTHEHYERDKADEAADLAAIQRDDELRKLFGVGEKAT